MNRDKIGTQTCYIHQCTKRYVDVHSMSVSQSCLCSFLCNSYITLQISQIFYLLVYICTCIALRGVLTSLLQESQGLIKYAFVMLLLAMISLHMLTFRLMVTMVAEF